MSNYDEHGNWTSPENMGPKACFRAIEAEVKSEAQDHEQALRYATEIAEYLAKKFYPEVTQWNPLDSLIGVLTKIDNMVSGIVTPVPCPKCADLKAELEEWRFTNKVDELGRERDALQAKVAEQSAEIERLAVQRDEYNSAWQRAGVEYRKLRDSLLSLVGEFK